MQFKYPDLLWALFLLLIPIFIHLFQLRKFKKTPFTNVALLKKVQLKSRKTRNLKKWLLLLTRLLLFTGLILAFAQPFFANKNALKKKETVIYLDNSFSMQAKTNNISLLQHSIQELIKNSTKKTNFSLFTNNNTYQNVTIKEIQNKILTLKHSNNQLNLNNIYIKAKTLFSKENDTKKNLILISDFQQTMNATKNDSLANINVHLAKITPDVVSNIAIDSAYISKINLENIELTAVLSATNKNENTAVSLYDEEKLIAKTAVVFNNNNTVNAVFTLPKNSAINGKIEIIDTGLNYDNKLYFTINKQEKIKVLVIADKATAYIDKIATNDEFLVTKFALKKLNYSKISTQNIIVLNELFSIPASLKNALHAFTTNGGSLIYIPATEIAPTSTNNLLNHYFNTSFKEKNTLERKITTIVFSHPIYKNVFEKEVTNFQFPTVKSHYKLSTNASTLLRFEDNSPFLIGQNGVYVFSASISKENSNFKGSPLIVPTIYNILNASFKFPKLYNIQGEISKIDIITATKKETILKLKKGTTEFIPLQQFFTNKTTLTFTNNPVEDGIYAVHNNSTVLGSVSFNYPRKESALHYINTNTITANTKNSSISNLFQNMENNQKVLELWKWFAIFAMFFIVIEVLIQKYLK